ncbi:mex-3 protein [Tribolium castaneum]|uniref:KH domain protein n=2 Tax=Tribolium castaneum TaxID=7070 RepID=B7FC52_TRICA|nr:mex-3 protein [Tribolium castaneum]CAM28380.2 KH domain protein [Tribolium castaneum]|eukprot:NP_001137201.1 mex-3 protein [Tribolium castaneum]
MNLVVAPEAGRQSVLGAEMPASSLFSDMDRGIGDERALQLALELSMLGFSEPLTAVSEPDAPADLAPFVGSLATVGLDEVRSKKSQNMTECVPVPSSEHVAEIVGRQGCKIKALRAKTNTYIKTPVRGEEPVFVVTGRKEDVAKAKREILSAAEHFSQIRASRKNNLAGLGSGASTPPGPPANIPGHVTIQVRVPYRVVGLVVGPKGATIKRIQHQTHTYIVTPSRDKEPVFEVTGLPESVESARREIEAHIAMRTGNGASMGLGGLDDGDLFSSLYKSGLSSILNYIEPEQFPMTGSSTFSSSGSCSSSSSSSGGRDLGAIWSSSERDEGLGDSPSFDSSTALSSIWSYPPVAPSRPSNSTSPADSLLGSAKCLVCGEAKVTHALVPCGHNFFCMECANRVCDGTEAQCPVCSLPAIQAIRIYSPNP